jgi:branched-chain amino acid transport system permease protein
MTRLWPLVLLALAIALPQAVTDPYIIGVLVLIWMNVALGSAWNIIGGLGGQHSLGHAAFFGMGTYMTLLFYQVWNKSPWVGMGFGILLAIVAAGSLGWICFRLRGPYFSLATIALAECLRIITTNWRSVTRGAEGIIISPDKIPHFFGAALDSKEAFYYVMLALAALSVGVTALIARSRLGYALVAVREDQEAAEALGVDSTLAKVQGLVISAAIVALVGGCFGLYLRYVDPETVLTLHRSVDMLLVAIMGGIGTIWGPVLGGFLLGGVSEAFRAFTGQANLLLYGIMVVVVILYLPGGILGALQSLLRKPAKREADV